jgi:ribose 5-phosphate isomerase B
MKIAIGCDHNGRDLKSQLSTYLTAHGHDVTDFGCASDSPVDYPDVAAPVARAIVDGDFDRGVLICGTGLGMAIAANKVVGIRAASVSDPYSAERARKSNDAQILCLGQQVVGASVAPILVEHWLGSEFQGGDSARKIEKISALEGH